MERVVIGQKHILSFRWKFVILRFPIRKFDFMTTSVWHMSVESWNPKPFNSFLPNYKANLHLRQFMSTNYYIFFKYYN